MGLHVTPSRKWDSQTHPGQLGTGFQPNDHVATVLWTDLGARGVSQCPCLEFAAQAGGARLRQHVATEAPLGTPSPRTVSVHHFTEERDRRQRSVLRFPLRGRGFITVVARRPTQLPCWIRLEASKIRRQRLTLGGPLTVGIAKGHRCPSPYSVLCCEASIQWHFALSSADRCLSLRLRISRPRWGASSYPKLRGPLNPNPDNRPTTPSLLKSHLSLLLTASGERFLLL